MGQKVCPIGLRLGIVESWRSRWYAPKKEFGKLLVEDYRIRDFIRRHYAAAGIARVDIERTRESIVVIVHTSSPGLIIGRRGAKVDQLTEDIESICRRKVDLRIVEIDRPELTAQLVAEGIAQQLEKRAPYRRTARKAAETAMNLGARGIKILLAGRIGGVEIARAEELALGSIPLSTLRAVIDYGQATAVLTKGTIGVKVWIYKGEVLPVKKTAVPKQENVHAVDAEAR